MNAPRERGLLGVRSSLLVRFICTYIVLKQCRETAVCSIRFTGPSALLGPAHWVPEIPRGIPYGVEIDDPINFTTTESIHCYIIESSIEQITSPLSIFFHLQYTDFQLSPTLETNQSINRYQRFHHPR